MSDKSRFVLAVVLSLMVVICWSLYKDHKIQQQHLAGQIIKEEEVATQHTGGNVSPMGMHRDYYSHSLLQEVPKSREHIMEMTSSERLYFSSPKLKGSIWLKGLKFDDATLSDYRETIVQNSSNVILLSPRAYNKAYFVDFSWVSLDGSVLVPNDGSMWKTDKKYIGPGETAYLVWENGQGVEFVVSVSIDDGYMLTIKKFVFNKSGNALHLEDQSRIFREHISDKKSSYISTEGVLGVNNHQVFDVSYAKLAKKVVVNVQDFSLDGKYADLKRWFGFSDKYWLTSLIPCWRDASSLRISHKGDNFEGTVYFDEVIPANGKTEHAIDLFVGARELDIIDQYKREKKIFSFDRAIDFGLLYFISRPMLMLLLFFHKLLGNFGLAIMALTIVVRAAMFVFSYKSYVSMHKMKAIQPEINAVKDRFAGNNEVIQRETLLLLRKHKVNPLSGCLPALLQLPVFFALYKVLYVSLEMRHAPFIGWIQDLSAPDPLNIFQALNFTGLQLPIFFNIGVLPVFFGLTMILQQRVQGSSMSAEHMAAMRFMPYLLVIMFSSFPSGLIIYWSWNNILSIVQQLVMDRLSGGVKAK